MTHANRKSVNLYCEALLKAIGVKVFGEGTREKGVEGVIDYLNKKGMDTTAFFMEDGSGLSPRNAVTPNHLSQLMKIIHSDKLSFDEFKNTLPLAGESGTLRYMFRKSVAKGKIYAKSGSMTRVRSYTGYIKGRSGKWIAFSVVLNDYTGKSGPSRHLLERFMENLYTAN